jgi:hypothetical protein
MKLPNDVQFLFMCERHGNPLEGQPELVHPNEAATAVWVFDTSDMSCPAGDNIADSNCQLTWEVVS